MSEPAWVPLGGAVSGLAPLVTALPGSPADGQECILTDSLTAPTYSWHLKYVAAKASNKWVFIGGRVAYSEVPTSESCSSTSYAALATAGPSIVIPVAGDYMVEIGCFIGPFGTVIGQMSYDIGGTAAVDADSVRSQYNAPSGDGQGTEYKSQKKSLTALTLTAKYKVSANNRPFADRFMRVTPQAIGG